MNQPRGHSAREQGKATPGGIQNEPSVHDNVQIIIRKPDGETQRMNVVLGWKQDFLVKEVSALIGMHRSQFYLTFGSLQLNGGETLLRAGIRNNSEVIVNGRLRGGGNQ